jgi:putative sugar O-methyltransferase
MIEHWNIPEILREQYLGFIRLCLVDENEFAYFKRHPAIKVIIENTDVESGYECLEKANAIIMRIDYPRHFNEIESISDHEKIGNPDIFNNIFGVTISPTTSRYLMHLSQIYEWFDDLNELVIGEIGAGYGGLCTIIHEYFDPKEYILFDLPEVMDFQVKYIKKFNPDINVSRNVKKDTKLDLILAFCSWSELDYDLKMDYLVNVISKAKKGVLAINYDYELNVELVRNVLLDKKITERIPGFIITFE